MIFICILHSQLEPGISLKAGTCLGQEIAMKYLFLEMSSPVEQDNHNSCFSQQIGRWNPDFHPRSLLSLLPTAKQEHLVCPMQTALGRLQFYIPFN